MASHLPTSHDGLHTRQPTQLSPWQRDGVLFVVLLVVGIYHWICAPATLDGDGVGYLRQVHRSGVVPGHWAYLPLIRSIAAVWPHQVLADLIVPLRLLSLAAALASYALFRSLAVNAAQTRRQAEFAAILFATSHAYGRTAQEVEVYSCALLATMLVLWSMSQQGAVRWRYYGSVCLSALSASAAVHLHLALILLTPAVMINLWQRSQRQHRAAGMALFCALMMLFGAAPLMGVCAWQNGWDIDRWLSWLLSADHGIPYPHSVKSIIAALWGMAKTLVVSPYPYEAPMSLVVGTTVLSLSAWGVLIVSTRQNSQWRFTQLAWLSPLALSAWLIPLTVFGLLFFPSDTERWVFVLPIVLLMLSSSRWLVPVAIGVAVINFALSMPAAFDRSVMSHAARIDQVLDPADLLIAPGHGWEEFVALTVVAPPKRFFVLHDLSKTHDVAQTGKHLAAAIADARQRGATVYVARWQDLRDHRGYKELDWMGLNLAKYKDLFSKHRITPTAIPELSTLTD